MNYRLVLMLAGLVFALSLPGPSRGEEVPEALRAAVDASKPIPERIAALRAAIQVNDTAIAQRKEGMAQMRAKLQTQIQETMTLQGPLIEQDESLRALQKEIDEKEQDLTRLRQQLHDRVAKLPLVTERAEVQRTLANEFMAEDAKLQESVNHSTQLNSALKGLEAQQQEVEGKAHERAETK